MSQQTASFQRVCGIDVSKHTLDAHWCTPDGQRALKLAYDAQGLQQIVQLCLQQQIQLVVVEASGGLQRQLVVALAQAAVPVAVVNPLRIRHFALAEGQIAKTDPLDARLICLFGLRMAPAPTPVRSDKDEKIARLVARRGQLMQAKVAEDNRQQQEADADNLKSIAQHLRFLQRQLQQLDRKLDRLVRQHEQLASKAELADQMTGIGRVSAVALVVSLPELGTMNRKRIASLAGLAPYNDDSGTHLGRRSIHGGRASARQALYMPTLTAIRYEGPIQRMYQRLLAAGKCKMQALTACMRKMLTILNARIAEALAVQRLQEQRRPVPTPPTALCP
jgi:transposase